METVLKANIFFFIASVATIIITILFSILLFYIIKAWKNIYIISESLKENYAESKEYITELKESLENTLIFKLFFPIKKRKQQVKPSQKGDKN